MRDIDHERVDTDRTINLFGTALMSLSSAWVTYAGDHGFVLINLMIY